MVDESRINNTLGKMALYLGNHDRILVSVSGGSDSDIIVHMVASYFREYLPKTHFVFVDTGMEFQATREHIKFLEDRYDIHIERIRGTPIPVAVHKYGVPIISKQKSDTISAYARGVPWAVRRVEAELISGKTDSFILSKKERQIANAVKERGIKVSSKCCNVSKKKPLYEFMKQNDIDLDITGERKSEGGIRAVAHKSCFEPNNHGRFDKFMPLFFWDDETKQSYKEREGIRYSDCYEVWGMKRTGCVGCQYNSKVGDVLRLLQTYEPNLHKACMNLFGESYRITDEFRLHRTPILVDKYPEPECDGQTSLFKEDVNQ